MLVRFPDGEVRAGLYDGTSDAYCPWLTTGDPWDELYGLIRGGPTESTVIRPWDEVPEGEVVDVEVYSDYGYGWVIPGRASRNVLVWPRTWNDTLDTPHVWGGDHIDDPKPDWVRAYFESEVASPGR